MSDALGLYVHIPFCIHKCPYCDFNTYAGLEGLVDAYVAALCREIEEAAARVADRQLTSVFVGGGTPTLLSGAQFGRVMAAIRAHFVLARGAEITSEANPGTVDEACFDALADCGVNRLSMGAQSFVGHELAFLGRRHSADDVGRAFAVARRAGFDNINLDLIFGLPDQTGHDLEQSLEALVALGPEHVSAYSLIVEPDTPLGHAVRTGRQKAPDDDEVAERYEQVVDGLGAAGYLHYEVSNWAKDEGGPAAPSDTSRMRDAGINPAFAARHNLLYWHNGEYVGVGPGAHSHLRFDPLADILTPARPAATTLASRVARVDRRWANLKPVPAYIRKMTERESVEAFAETLDAPTAMAETMMLGLRLVREGVPRERFEALHGTEVGEVYADAIAALERDGLLRQDAERLILTPRGLRLHSHVAMAFLPDDAG